MAKKDIPYNFVFDYLPSAVIAKPAFGMYFIYVQDKIVLILCRREKQMGANGIWIATDKKSYASLLNDFPSVRPFADDKNDKRNWLLLPESAVDFEQAAITVCELIAKRDRRIGRVPER